MYIKGHSQKIEKQPGRWEKLFANHISNKGLISKIFKEFLEFPGSFPGSSVGKESACNAGDQGLIPGSGRSPREGNGNPLQYSCLENPVDRGAWWATVHGVTQTWTRLKHLSMHACIGEGNSNPLQYSWRSQWHPTPVLLPQKSHGRRSLVGCPLWGRTESDTTEAT